MASRAWNPALLLVLLIGSTLLLAMHAWSLRQQLSELRIQAVRYRTHLERVSREKTEIRMTLGHVQRAMEKHSLRSKQAIDMEDTLRTKQTEVLQLQAKLDAASKALVLCRQAAKKKDQQSMGRVSNASSSGSNNRSAVNDPKSSKPGGSPDQHTNLKGPQGNRDAASPLGMEKRTDLIVEAKSHEAKLLKNLKNKRRGKVIL